MESRRLGDNGVAEHPVKKVLVVINEHYHICLGLYLLT